ncbi:MAG: hypothetical protein VX624_16580, partial [Pseudomonadota bacterium]|nr:hypothetical protein [Pseudomonadota bacterium]
DNMSKIWFFTTERGRHQLYSFGCLKGCIKISIAKVLANQQVCCGRDFTLSLGRSFGVEINHQV